MGLKGAQSSSSGDTSVDEQSDEKPSKQSKKLSKVSKKEKKKRKKEKKKAKKLKKKTKKLKKLRRKLREHGEEIPSSSSSSSSKAADKSAAPICRKTKAVTFEEERRENVGNKDKAVVAEEESREQVGLKLFGELFAVGKPDSQLKWEYPLRDEKRRCFVGLLRTELPQGTLDRLYATIRDGACWDQPKRPQSGELLPRKTDWMVAQGCLCRYRYGGVEVDPSVFPPWMEDVMETCMPLCGLRGRARWPNCCNLNLYEDGGMTVGWHADDEELFQGKTVDCPIVSFSLGQQRTFEIKVSASSNGDEVQKFELRNGDLLTMEGLIQKHYHHRVPREKSSGPRINLTWRWIKKHQARCPLSR